ncbi:hypothetical protein DL93DRAFT_1117553 [Clavulina sp. PMI_390]|nr:hypothetical protein DL93DRAFT_1117553 [Clavulina sp. PMI_390]
MRIFPTYFMTTHGIAISTSCQSLLVSLSEYAFYFCTHPHRGSTSVRSKILLLTILPLFRAKFEIYQWDYRQGSTFTQVASIQLPSEHRNITFARIGAQVVFDLYPSRVLFWDWERNLTRSLALETREPSSWYNYQFTSAGTPFAFSVSRSSNGSKLKIESSPLVFDSQNSSMMTSPGTQQSQILLCDIAKLRYSDQLDVHWLQPTYVSLEEIVLCFRIRFRTHTSFVFVSVSNDVIPTLVVVLDANAAPPPSKNLIDFWFIPRWTFAIPLHPRDLGQRDRELDTDPPRGFLDRILRRLGLHALATTMGYISPAGSEHGQTTIEQTSSPTTPESASRSDRPKENSFDFILIRRPSFLASDISASQLPFEALVAGISFSALPGDAFLPVRCVGFCGRSGTWVFHKPAFKRNERQRRWQLSFVVVKYE